MHFITVHLQPALSLETHLAHFALEWSFPSVGPLFVRLVRPFLVEFSFADIALVSDRSPLVIPHVKFESLQVLEVLGTLLALVRRDASVNAQMLVQVAHLCKTLGTVTTHVRFLTRVNARVLAQVCVAGERLLAHCAHKSAGFGSSVFFG